MMMRDFEKFYTGVDEAGRVILQPTFADALARAGHPYRPERAAQAMDAADSAEFRRVVPELRDQVIRGLLKDGGRLNDSEIKLLASDAALEKWARKHAGERGLSPRPKRRDKLTPAEFRRLMSIKPTEKSGFLRDLQRHSESTIDEGLRLMRSRNRTADNGVLSDLERLEEAASATCGFDVTGVNRG